MPGEMGMEALDAATKWKHKHDELLKALQAIAAENDLDPSPACKIARDAINAVVGSEKASGGNG
jgi:hypothetical protein